ncbi:MAG: enoyl-CoA hydratase/isomerase family protein [Chloroflexi bacterium]|nr:enoyl-CoA hydratase/isomerase family protein [Chloroflexota bacterium]
MPAVLYEKKGNVAYITLNRPEVMNAMDQDVYNGLNQAFHDIDTDPNIRVGIVTGAGDKAFSAGADLKKMHSRHVPDEFWQPWRQDQFYLGLNVAKPLIAAINGYCLAGALELATFCDIRIASENSSFGAPEVRWNLLHGYGALRLVQAIPLASAMELLLTGKRIDAKEALRIGLVSRVVPSSKLMPTAMEIADAICENGPMAVKVTKELALRGANMPLDQAIRLFWALRAIVYESEDTKEGPMAFSEKRKPVFKGR